MQRVMRSYTVCRAQKSRVHAWSSSESLNRAEIVLIGNRKNDRRDNSTTYVDFLPIKRDKCVSQENETQEDISAEEIFTDDG